MIDLKGYEVWFVTGSQHLYGPKTLEEVAVHSKEIAAACGCLYGCGEAYKVMF